MNNKYPYAFGQDEFDPDRDQRNEFRLVGRASVSLELESVEPGSRGLPRAAAAESSDVSSGGLGVVTTEPLTPGALLPASIHLHDVHKTCSLTVEVVWCRPAESGGWQSGLKILETGDEDYVAWMDAVARAMEGEGLDNG